MSDPGGGWPPPPQDEPPAGAFPVYTPNAPVATAPTNGMAVASLVAAVLGIACVPVVGSVLALVFGYIALSQIRSARGAQEGRGLALAGVIVGWIGVALNIVLIASIVALSLGASGIDEPRGLDVDRSSREETGSQVPARTPPVPDPPTATGEELRTLTLIDGVGAGAAPGDTLVVHYVGVLADRTTFESSWQGEPFSFELGAGVVIAGWDRGLVGVKLGERRHLDIGPELAYGHDGSGPIPPDAALAFDVDVVDIQRGG